MQLTIRVQTRGFTRQQHFIFEDWWHYPPTQDEVQDLNLGPSVGNTDHYPTVWQCTSFLLGVHVYHFHPVTMKSHLGTIVSNPEVCYRINGSHTQRNIRPITKLGHKYLTFEVETGRLLHNFSVEAWSEHHMASFVGLTRTLTCHTPPTADCLRMHSEVVSTKRS